MLADLDSSYDRKGDVGEWNRRAAEDKADLIAVADDPDRLAKYWKEMERLEPSTANRSDDDLAERSRRTAESSFLTQPKAADGSAQAW